MFALLVRRNFALLWVGHTISIAGDYIFFFAISYWAYARTGSSLATGAVLVSSTLPLLLCAPIAGWVVDRYDRRRVMLLAEGARGLLFLLTLAVLLRLPGALWPIYVVGFAQSALAAFFWPARSATLPQLVSGGSLLPANALYQFTDGAVRVVAPTLAALALLRLGVAGVVALDAATFVISAACIVAMEPLPTWAPTAPRSLGARSRASRIHARNVCHGVRCQPRVVQRGQPTPGDTSLGGIREAVAIYMSGAVIAFVGGSLGVLLPTFVRASLRTGPLVYGWLFTAQAVGDIAVSALLWRSAHSPRPPSASARGTTWGAIAASLMGVGASLTVIAASAALAPALAASGALGGLTAFVSVQILTLLQRCAHNRRLGRRLARFAAMQACAQLVGLTLASLVAVCIQAPWLIALDGAIALACDGVVWALFTVRLRFHVKRWAPRP